MLLLTISDAAYRVVLYVYPRSYRTAYGSCMAQVFADSSREALRRHGVLGLVPVWLNVMSELLPTAIHEHLTEVDPMTEGMVREWPEGRARQRSSGDVGVVDASGYINADGGSAIAEIVERLIGSDVQRIVLNLSEMNVINSVGIARLREALERIRATGGKAEAFGVSRTITRTFEKMGVSNLVGLRGTEEEALEAVAD